MEEFPMNPMSFKHLPVFVRKEIEVIFDAIQPKMKKFSMYRFLAFPLMAFPILNLTILLLTGGWYIDAVPSLSIYAIVAAIGLALFKESKHIKKDIENIGMERMIERIRKSDLMNEHRKEKYIMMIKGQPRFGFQAFLEFLNEEHKRKQRAF
jgi:hypothetical protein